MFCADSVAVAE